MKTSVVVFCCVALISCRIFEIPEPRLPEKLPVKIFNITPDRPALRIEGIYYNSNSFGFQIEGGELDLMLDTILLGHVKVDTVINVRPNSLFTVPVFFEPDFVKLSQMPLNFAEPVLISFKGFMHGSVGWFSKEIEIEYSDMHILDIRF